MADKLVYVLCTKISTRIFSKDIYSRMYVGFFWIFKSFLGDTVSVAIWGEKKIITYCEINLVYVIPTLWGPFKNHHGDQICM